MSHVATVEVEVKDLDAFRVACAAVGMELVEGQTTFAWFGEFMNDYHGQDAAFKSGIRPEDYGKCAHAARVRGDARAYEVGLVQKANGAHALVWDFYGARGRALEAVAGKACGKLVSAYVTEVARRTLHRAGFQAAGRTVKADGTVELVFSRG